MNLVDLVILLLVLLGLRRGLRLGLLSLTLSAAGFLLGLYLGSLLANLLGGGIADAVGRVLAAVTVSLVTGFLLAEVGESIAMAARPHVERYRLRKFDKGFGAAFEVAFVLLVVWLIASALSNVQAGSIGRQVRSSAIISTLNGNLPPPPDILSQLESIIDASGFPKAFIGNEPRRGPVPNTTPLSDEVIRTAQASVVQIMGRGCGGIIEGSGFVAGSNIIMTNAHVVAGINNPRVIATDGNTYNATPIYFNPNLDMALLRVEGLSVPALPITADIIPNGSSVAVMGHPGGGPLTISSGVILENIQAVGRDIYDRGIVTRDIYEVQAHIESGNSGGPMIDGEGRVVGLVFAKSVTNDNVGYTLLSSEVIPALERYGASQSKVGTGRCAAD
jgi:S1-C subfamily serine protease